MPSEVELPDGNPFSIDSLKEIRIKSANKNIDLLLYPAERAHSGQEPFMSLVIEETLFSPIVSGTLTVKDVGNFVENLNLEGFEDIVIKFAKIKNSNPTTFKGIITDVVLISDDAVLANRMNSTEYYRFYAISFMNKDVFIANYKTPQDTPKNELNVTDFVGWISKSDV